MNKTMSEAGWARRMAVVATVSIGAVLGLVGSASASPADAPAADEGTVISFNVGGKEMPAKVTGDVSKFAGRAFGWEDNNFSGDRYIDVGQGECSEDKCEIDGWNGDNEISSVNNDSTCKLRLFANDAWTGRFYDLNKQTSNGNLSSVGFDNEAESLQFIC
ncbi:hypothetical protein SAMN04488564_101952 [Lentzea waywayandensis]|uniref:Peptidase inhibitor family I36 n=2 Tax=Lentzea waywayandensis TaxID=84724 RepID=A0A1I6D384_9PSEU|nr:hypothetical protein SAMN04488564_101952 [Lentzea waywayandensis]